MQNISLLDCKSPSSMKRATKYMCKCETKRACDVSGVLKCRALPLPCMTSKSWTSECILLAINFSLLLKVQNICRLYPHILCLQHLVKGQYFQHSFNLAFYWYTNSLHFIETKLTLTFMIWLKSRKGVLILIISVESCIRNIFLVI